MTIDQVMKNPELDDASKDFFYDFNFALTNWMKDNTNKVKSLVNKNISKREIMNGVRRDYKIFVQEYFSEYRDKQLDLYNEGMISVEELNNRLCWMSEEDQDENLDEIINKSMGTSS